MEQGNYSRPHTVLSATGLGALLGLGWILTAVVARTCDATYLPLALRFFGAAAILFFLPLMTTMRLPQISLRLLHAAITVAALAYVVSPVLLVEALRSMPSGGTAVIHATLPLWLGAVAYGMRREKLNVLLVTAIGIGMVCIGMSEEAGYRGNLLRAMACLGGAMGAMLLGVWVSRRLFWLHAALDLNFWSMVLAGFAHLVFGLRHHEMPQMNNLQGSFWIALAILTFGVTGLGSYFYRLEAMRKETAAALVVAMPTVALGLGIYLWGETPPTPLLLIGSAVILAVIGFEAFNGSPSQWLCSCLNNDKRQGDRLLCMLDGTVRGKGEVDPVMSKVQIFNLSLGGIGLRSERIWQPGDEVTIILPLSYAGSTVTIEGRIAHGGAGAGKVFRWSGGIEFTRLSDHRRQSLVEFLARLSKAEEEQAQEAPAEAV